MTTVTSTDSAPSASPAQPARLDAQPNAGSTDAPANDRGVRETDAPADRSGGADNAPANAQPSGTTDVPSSREPAAEQSGEPVAVFPIPSSLSPSRVSSFTSCPMQFRFSSVQRLPEPPGVATTKGTIVHRALELLFELPGPARTPEALATTLERALDEYSTHPDYVGLQLDDDAATTFRKDCSKLIARYFDMEDPTAIRDIGLEVRMAAQVGSLELRGIIDRLELDDDGELVVTDYKTGRPPSGNYEQKSLAGVHFYSFLCEAVLGKRPSKIRLMYLSTGETIETVPSAQSVRFIQTRTKAVWNAVERACTTGDFRPNQSRLCNWCSFQQWCPAFDGDPDRADVEAVDAYNALMVGATARTDRPADTATGASATTGDAVEAGADADISVGST